MSHVRIILPYHGCLHRKNVHVFTCIGQHTLETIEQPSSAAVAVAHDQPNKSSSTVMGTNDDEIQTPNDAYYSLLLKCEQFLTITNLSVVPNFSKTTYYISNIFQINTSFELKIVL